MAWWYPFKVSRGYQVPDPNRQPIESTTKPTGDHWGPFHCQACAETCGSFGKTEQQAFDFNHGSADESFCVFLVG